MSGYRLTTSVSIEGAQISSIISIGVDTSSDNEGLESDGLVGLTPESHGTADLLVDKLFAEGLIGEPMFGTKYGLTN